MKHGPIGDRKYNSRKMMMKSRSIEKQKQKQLRGKVDVSNIKGKEKEIVNSADETYEVDNIHILEPDEGKDRKSNEGNPLLGLVDELKLFIHHKAAEGGEQRNTCQCAAVNKDLLTEGEKVTTQGSILRTLWEKTKKQPHLVCKVDAFSKLVGRFDLSRREVVRSMGFEGLLQLKLTYLPRQFCYWLMTRVCGDGTLLFGDGQLLALCPEQIHYVLGVPMGSKPVPTTVDTSNTAMLRKVREIGARFGDTKSDNISVNAAAKALLSFVDDDEEGEVLELVTAQEKESFRDAFLVVALGQLLCTTTNELKLASALLPCVSVAGDAAQYDWCSFIFDWVRDTAKGFQSSFQKNGYRAGCGGCILFLLIFYVDHLRRIPVGWGVYPRLAVWSQDAVKAAMLQDRKTDDSYGKLPSLNIAYGEDHPLIPREINNKSMVDQVAEKVICLLTPQLRELVKEVLLESAGKKDTVNEEETHGVIGNE